MGGTRLWTAEFGWALGLGAALDGWHAAQELGARGVWMARGSELQARVLVAGTWLRSWGPADSTVLDGWHGAPSWGPAVLDGWHAALDLGLAQL